ncbi:SFRICE_015007 [Gryllus bimaculatus]|nr:SFRICE_015007 [Gryllus bimaculatus]
MDGGVVLLGLLLLAAASQKSSTPQASPAVPTQVSMLELEEDRNSSEHLELQELLNQKGQLEAEVQFHDESKNQSFNVGWTLDMNSTSSGELNESLHGPTTAEPPMSTDIFTVKNNSQEPAAASAGGAPGFHFHAEALPWLDAVRACWRRGGRLAAPHSPREARALGELLRAAAPHTPALHVGVSDLDGGRWATLQGYDVWLGNHSSVAGRPSCAALVPNGLYIRSSCGATRPFACEMPVVADGYDQLPGLGQYRIHPAPLPWLDALGVCRGEGATLVAPASPLEAGFLAGAYVFNSPHAHVREHGVFVGIADYANENDWQTVAGRRSQDYYNSWSSEEDHDGQGGNCAVLKSTGRYERHPCEEPAAFFCKQTRFPGNAESVSGYQTIPGVGTYRLHTSRATWFEAFLECHKENATLAAPHTLQAAQELTAWIRGALEGDSYFHVGYHDIDGDGTFESISGK